jgi:hypothetical protein
MTNPKSVTQQPESVTEQRDAASRARTPSSGGDVTVSRCHAERDVTNRERDSDRNGHSRSRHDHEKRSLKAGPQPVSNWLQIGALNLIADHEAGIAVPEAKLELARRVVQQMHADRARISRARATGDRK